MDNMQVIYTILPYWLCYLHLYTLLLNDSPLTL